MDAFSVLEALVLDESSGRGTSVFPGTSVQTPTSKHALRLAHHDDGLLAVGPTVQLPKIEDRGVLGHEASPRGTAGAGGYGKRVGLLCGARMAVVQQIEVRGAGASDLGSPVERKVMSIGCGHAEDDGAKAKALQAWLMDEPLLGNDYGRAPSGPIGDAGAQDDAAIEWDQFGGDVRMNGSCSDCHAVSIFDGRERSRSRQRRSQRHRARQQKEAERRQWWKEPVIIPCAAPWFSRFDSFGAACLHMIQPKSQVAHKIARCTMLHNEKMTYDKALVATRSNIKRELARSDATWYLGITEAPERRWTEHLDSGIAWDEMVILLEAATSSTTAAMERQLLSEFATLSLRCTNASAGGERASRSSPHYLYMLLNYSGLHRRPPRRQYKEWA